METMEKIKNGWIKLRSGTGKFQKYQIFGSNVGGCTKISGWSQKMEYLQIG